MPFNPSPETLACWKSKGSTLATDADIAKLEARLGLRAPASYVEFVKTYGDVEFSFDVNCQFEYTYETRDRVERRTEAVSFIKSTSQAIEYYNGFQRDDKIGIPANLLPFAMDHGQGELLIEFGQAGERIFYWDFDAHDWESGITRIGFVANDMYDFINNLKPFDG